MVDHKSCRYVKSSISWGPASHSSTTQMRLEISALNFSDTGLFLYFFIMSILCWFVLYNSCCKHAKICWIKALFFYLLVIISEAKLLPPVTSVKLTALNEMFYPPDIRSSQVEPFFSPHFNFCLRFPSLSTSYFGLGRTFLCQEKQVVM